MRPPLVVLAALFVTANAFGSGHVTFQITAAPARQYSPGDHVRVLVFTQSYAGVVKSAHIDTVFTIRYDAGYGDYTTLLEYMQPMAGGTPSIGDAVKVRYGQGDYTAHVIATRQDYVYKVRYADGSEWDTLADYMRPAAYYHAWNAGERVQVLWKGVWYDARVLRVVGNDRYRVHYDGYGDNFDEDVAGERVRNRQEKPAAAAVASSSAPVEYMFVGMEPKAPVPQIRYRIRVKTSKPIEEVDIALKYVGANGRPINDTTLVWQNIVKSKRQPIENGRTYEDTSYMDPGTARVESRLVRVVYADGTRWNAPQ